MAKKNSKKSGIPRIFTPPGSHDPFGNFLAEAGNIGANKLLRTIYSFLEKLPSGKTAPTPEEQYNISSNNISLQKQQTDLVKAQTQRLKAAAQLKLTEYKVAEKEIQLEKTRQQSTEVSIQRTEVDIHVKTEVISGALNVVATSGGLVVPDGQRGEDQEWLDSLPGTVGVITGKRGSGKSSMGARIGEFMQATRGFPFFWLAIPTWAQDLLPSWVRIVDSLEQCPNNCFILIDEAGLSYLSLHFADKRNVYLRQQLMLACPHKGYHFLS